jgi:hypothetical protein
MRTTLTLEPDVEALVHRVMRERGISLKEAVNAGLRRGLRSSDDSPVPFKPRVFDMGRPLVDLTRANALAADLEDEALIQKLRAGS